MTINSELLSIYLDAFKIRAAENLMAGYYLEEKIFSFVHFSSGQELAPVAVSSRLGDGDRVFGNHRSHAHYLACGGDMMAMFLEMLGSTRGGSKGFGGSMHLLDKSCGFWGSSPVLGSIAPIAAGSAFEQKYRSPDSGITVAFVGDGASEEGVVSETLNLISVWKLPLLLVIEDNLYAVNSPSKVRRPANFDFREFAEAFGLDFFRAPRFEVSEHIAISKSAVDWVKSSRGPAVLLAESFRNLAHSSPLSDDHMGYRELDREEARNFHDHLAQLRTCLVKNLIEPARLEEMEGQVISEVQNRLSTASKEARNPKRESR